MHLVRLFAVSVLILLSAGMAFASEHRSGFAKMSAPKISATVKRNDVLSDAKNLARTQSEDVLDCSTYVSDGKAILPPVQTVFQVGEDVNVPPADNAEYIGGIWSPKGDSILFSAPDGGIKIEDHDAAPSDEPSPLFAVGTSSLFLYSLQENNSEKLVTSSRMPTWASNGDAIYYFDASDLMKFDLKAHSANKTGASIPATGASLLFSRPLPDGTLLAPRTPHGPFEIQESQAPALHEISVSEIDQVHISPSGDKLVVGRGSNTYQGVFNPATTVLYDGNGGVTPLLQNCQYSAANMAWSPSGDKLAYPVHTSQPEIRIYDLNSKITNIVIRFDDYTQLGSVSWSPDGKFLLFTDIVKNVVWVVDSNGNFRQQLFKNALMPKWSPDGSHILFARKIGESASWYITQINQK